MRENRFLRILLCLSLGLSQVAGPAPLPIAEAAEAPQGEIQQALRVASELKDKLPRQSFDPAALLTTFGANPTVETLFAFVRDKIRLVPYRGALRGARGTLMDGSGNSLDRALLLGELLRVSGRSVRLVNGALAGPAADDLAAEIAAGPPFVEGEPIDTFLASTNATIDAIGKETGIPTSPLAQAIAEGLASLTEQRAEVVRHAKAQSGALLGAMPVPPADVGGEPQSEALRDHWWIQYRDDANTWRNLDPSRPQASVGETLTAVGHVYDVDPAKPIEMSLSPGATCYFNLDLPETCLPNETPFHRLRLKLVIEQWSSEGLAEHVALDATFTPALALEQSIAIRIIPVSWSKDMVADTAETVVAQLAAATEWRPHLVIGDKVTPGQAFNDKGFLTEKAPDAKENTGGGLFGTTVDKMADAVAQIGGGHLTAAWIDYVVTAPGLPEQTVRRQICDLTGPAARSAGVTDEPQISSEKAEERALALSQSIEILPMVGWLTPSFVAQRQAAQSTVMTRAVENGTGFARDLGGFAGLTTLPLLALAYTRHIWSEHAGDIYLGSLNVLTSHVGPARTANGSTYSLNFDVVRNDVDVRPGSKIEARAVRLSQGVADTIAEASLLAAASPHANAAFVFAASGAENIPWRVLDEGDDLSPIKVDADLKARLAQALAAHSIVVAPEGPVISPDGDLFAWWQIDPRSWTTLGMDSRGWGADTSEYPIDISISTGSLQTGALVTSEAAAEGQLPYLVLIGFVTLCLWLPQLGKLSNTIKDESEGGICKDWSRKENSIGDSLPQVQGE